MPTIKGQTSPPISTREWVSIREASLLGYGSQTTTLCKRIADGALTGSKVGRVTKVRRADLDSLVTPVHPPDRDFEDVEGAVERIVASAPPLYDAQVGRLSSLLGGVA